jgi:hypothetical protein
MCPSHPPALFSERLLRSHGTSMIRSAVAEPAGPRFTPVTTMISLKLAQDAGLHSPYGA